MSSFRERIRLEELERAVPYLPPGGRILEIGAGSGWQARALAERGFDVVAVDVAASEYREGQVYDIRLYDGRHLPFADGEFDAVFSSNVLEHVPHVAALDREIMRVVRPGGVAVHVVPTATWRLWTFATHYGYAVRVAWRLVAARGERAASADEDDMCLTRNLDALRAQTPAQRVRRAFGRLVAGRHGEVGSAVGELVRFSRFRWRPLFRRSGWRLRGMHGNRLAYTGYFLLGPRLPLRWRSALSRWCGSSCMIYVLERPPATGSDGRP